MQNRLYFEAQAINFDSNHIFFESILDNTYGLIYIPNKTRFHYSFFSSSIC